MENKIIETLKLKNETIATAESLTGGLLGAKLVNVSGASKVFKGSIVAYMLEMKETLLNVPLFHTTKTDGVDEETAIMMAKNICEITGSDYGVSTTGIAEKWDERPEQAFICVYDNKNKEFLTENVFFDIEGKVDPRQYCREKTVESALKLCFEIIG